MPSANVVAVADLREDRLKFINGLYHDIVMTKDYHDLFDMNLDAVVIATPPATHYPLACDALNHGLHVLVEKPITTSSAQAEELIDLAQQKNLALMVGHTFEFNAAVHTLKTLVGSGELGKIYYMDTARLNLGLFQSGLNALWDLAPHDLSILMYVLDSAPISVEVSGMDCVFKGIQDIVYMNLVFPNNVLAHVHVSWLDPCKVRRVTVVASKKMVVYNDVEPTEKIKIYDKGVDIRDYEDSASALQWSYRYGDVVIPNIKMVEPLRMECQHFIDSIVNDTRPMTSGENGMRVVKILETAQHSLMNGHHKEVLEW
jgi:predicted dehydrogenase